MNSLDSREMGTIPVSIATALAIDGLYNRHPDLKPSPSLPANKATHLYINARTLFRNIHGAVGDRVKADAVSVKDYADVLINEIAELKTALKNEIHPLEVVVYLPSYKRLADEFGKGTLRIPSTPIQKKYVQLENDTLQEVFNRYEKESIKPFLDTDIDIDVVNGYKIFLLSHIVHDLLFVRNASEVLLLESHTGVIKGKNLWYTKFQTEKEQSIPFNKATLLFFGDSSNIFVPQPIKARKRFIEIAKQRMWNPQTTVDRMILGLELSKEPHIYKTIVELLR